MSTQTEIKNDLFAELDASLESRIQANFNRPAQSGATASNDRLREMSKKLPSWSLEPPYSFLK